VIADIAQGLLAPSQPAAPHALMQVGASSQHLGGAVMVASGQQHTMQ